MTRRRRTSISEDNLALEETTENSVESIIEEKLEESEEVVTEPETEVEEVVLISEPTVESEPVPAPEPEETAPVSEVIVIDVEAGRKVKENLKGKPHTKAKDSKPKSRPVPMPKRNVPKFVRR